MLTDPLFYLVAIPALLIMGISKGGLGGGLGIVSVPLMSLVIAPSQAAAIMLPILCVMDGFALWGFRGQYDKANLRTILPAALLGIGVGAATYSYLSDSHIRLMVGLIALVFSLNWLYHRWRGNALLAQPQNRVKGWILGAVSGFTSFSVHSGGPPLDMYLLPQRLPKGIFVGTTIIFFTVANYTKLIPYSLMGLLDTTNLMTSLSLIILAPIGVRLGMLLHHRMTDGWFYWLCYCLLLVAGIKLSWDGASALLAAGYP
jgi:uncharacterized membrane protein YfcA